MQYDTADKGTEDENFKRLFSSSMYSHLTSFDNPVPKKLRREALDLIGEHDGFFGRHPQYLLSTLDLLLGAWSTPRFWWSLHAQYTNSVVQTEKSYSQNSNNS